MSKSLGNFVTINDALQQSSGASMRFAMLMTHYTQPIDWMQSKLLEARMSLQKFNRWYVEQNINYETDFDPTIPHKDVLDALNDDLNTPEAFASLHRQVGELSDRSFQATHSHNQRLAEFANSLDILGLVPKEQISDIDTTKIDAFVSSRLAARAAKNWKESDRIRDELTAMGVTIMDNKDGTTSWEVKR